MPMYLTTILGRWVAKFLALSAVLAATNAAGAQAPKTVQSVNNSLYLDADTNTQGNGAKVQLWESNGAAQQKWHLKDAGGGLFYIQSVNNSLYLDADTNTQGNGAKVQLWEFNGAAQQKWRLQAAN